MTPARIARLMVTGIFSLALLLSVVSRVEAQQFLPPPITPTSATPAPSVVPSPSPTPVPDGKPLIELGLLRPLMQRAMAQGTEASLLTLLLLLPVVASLVAFSRHVIGLTGFSIYAPTGLAIVFLSTGILPGITLFLLMLAVASVSKWAIYFLKLEYIPRSAMMLWAVSVGLFLTVVLSVFVPALGAFKLEIFPLLLLVLLAEDFMAPQAGLKWNLIFERSLQILFLAVVGAILMDSSEVRAFALLNPELVIASVAVVNFLTGRYLGLRLTEYFRFRPLMDAEE